MSIDAYQYFGTDSLYLHYLSRFLRPGGTIGVVVPGLMQPLAGAPPEHLTSPQRNGACFWEDECACFATVDEWRDRWTRCSRVTLRLADTLPDGWRHWRDFERALERAGKNQFPSVAEALDADQGQFLGFVRLVATRTDASGENLYDADLVAKLAVNGR